MTSLLNRIIPNTPETYYREYEHDVGDPPAKTWVNQTYVERFQRVTIVALPFIALYKPLSIPLTLGLGGARTISTMWTLVQSVRNGGNRSTVSIQTLQTVISVSSLAATVFAHPLGMLLATGQDLILDSGKLLGHVYARDASKVLDTSARIVNNSLYLALFIHGGLELTIASTGMQMILAGMQAHIERKDRRYLEFVGATAMAYIRGRQLVGQVCALQDRWTIECLTTDPMVALPHNIRDTLSRHILYISSLCRAPIAWTGWGGGFLGYFGPTEIAGRVAMRCRSKVLPGEYDNQSSYLKEVSYRVALCFASTLALPIAYPLLVVGTVLRDLGFLIQANDFTLIQSPEDLKGAKSHTLSILWENVCGVFSGMGRDHGGMADWEVRKHEIAEYIRSQDKTVVGLTEIYDLSLGFELYEELKDLYPFAIPVAGASTMGAPSGLIILSKTPLIDPSFHRFGNSSWMQRRGFLSVAVDTEDRGVVRLIFTHLTSSPHDSDPSLEVQEERLVQLREIESHIASQQAAAILSGDLNISRGSDEQRQLDQFTYPSAGEEGHTYTNRHYIRMWDPREYDSWWDYFFGEGIATVLSEHWLDYIREFKREGEDQQLDLTVHVGAETDVEGVGPLSDHRPVMLDERTLSPAQFSM